MTKDFSEAIHTIFHLSRKIFPMNAQNPVDVLEFIALINKSLKPENKKYRK